jgi:NAD(P)-dependent dehydrogenase (short-subunit alcohol dehydrogenase family)
MADKLDHVRPMFELRGRNYLVTGGAQGIGFAATRAICEMGGNVAVLDIQDRPTDEFDNLASEFAVKTFYHQSDLKDQDSLNAGFAKALESLGTIDGCIPAAGIAIDKPFVDQTWEEFTSIQEINVSSQVIQHICPISLLTKLGPGHFLHRTACSEADHQAELRRQCRSYCLAIVPHWTSRIQDGSI